ncbi:MAG: sigma-70 family RNA polymerase sigma factor [Parcubacteria group bacterium]
MTPAQQVQCQTTLTRAHKEFGKSLNSYAFSKVHDSSTSEDLVQDTFIKTWGYLVKGGKIDVMKAFLYHVLNNLIVDKYRKHKTASLDTMLEKGFEPSVDHSERLFNTLEGKAVVLLIRHLPEKYQRVMKMRYEQDLSLKEISAVTGQTRNTVAVQMHRGLRQLKGLYREAEQAVI